jgi:hypothetical protein
MTGGTTTMIICLMVLVIMMIPSPSLSYSSSLQPKSHGIHIDQNGIPYVNYDEWETKFSGLGIQRNPVTIIHTAMDYYNTGNTEYFINNVNWLVNNAVQKDGFSIFEYGYDWPTYSLKQPWRSAMANGEALTPLVKAHEITGDMLYLDTAKELLNSFIVKVEHGGITYIDSYSSWLVKIHWFMGNQVQNPSSCFIT